MLENNDQRSYYYITQMLKQKKRTHDLGQNIDFMGQTAKIARVKKIDLNQI